VPFTSIFAPFLTLIPPIDRSLQELFKSGVKHVNIAFLKELWRLKVLKKFFF